MTGDMNRQPPWASDPGEAFARATDGDRRRERMFANTVATLVSQAAGDGCLLAAALIQIRTLSPTAWGLFGLLLSVFDVLRVLTDAGLHVVGIRLLAIGARSPRAIVGHVLLIKTVLCGVGFSVMIGLSIGVPAVSVLPGAACLLGVALFPVAYAGGLTLRFQAEHRMERLIVPRAVAGACYLAAVAAGARFGLGLAGYVMLCVAYHFLVWMATGFASRRAWPLCARTTAPSAVDWRLARAMALEAGSVALLMLLVIAYARLGVFLLHRLGSLVEVGQYYAAVKLTEPLLSLAGAFSSSAFPVLTRLVDGGQIVAARRRYAIFSRRSAFFTCSVAALASAFGRPLLGWIQPNLVPASGAFVALAWATACMFQNQLSTAMINSFGKFHYVTGIALVNLVVFLGLAVLLVPRLGAAGAALALLGTEALNTAMQMTTALALLGRRCRHLDESVWT